jgi:chromatin remodeling complex protein RSC6
MPTVAPKKQSENKQNSKTKVVDAEVVIQPVVKKSVKIAPAPVTASVAEPVVKVESKVDMPVSSVEDVSSVVVEDKPVIDSSTVIDNSVQILADKIGSLAALIKDIQSSLKPVLKEHDKLRKIVDRIQKKRDNARKSPSGFAKPNKISDELCDFINVPHGTEKSRTEITRYINAYVKEHNLNKPTNRRIILPDDKLKNILKINNDEEVTFFILQRLISHHFPSNATKVAAAAAAAATAATTTTTTTVPVV